MIEHKGRQIPETFEEIVDPKHTAFVVHELLNDFCAEGGAFDQMGMRIDASEIVAPVAKMLDAARANNVRVIYVRYTMNADQSSLTDLDVWRSRDADPNVERVPAVVDGTWGWQNLPGVEPLPEELIVRKYKVDAFFESPLDALLRWNGIKTFVIVGIGAEVGMVPTVIHGGCLGYFSVAVEDCLRGTVAARLDGAMTAIADWSIVKNHQEVIDAWNASGG